MPLPKETMEQIASNIEKAEAAIKEVEDVISDLRDSGVDTTLQSEQLATQKENLRQLSLFYGKQTKRIGDANGLET